jgi:hypothetical protein
LCATGGKHCTAPEHPARQTCRDPEAPAWNALRQCLGAREALLAACLSPAMIGRMGNQTSVPHRLQMINTQGAVTVHEYQPMARQLPA